MQRSEHMPMKHRADFRKYFRRVNTYLISLKHAHIFLRGTINLMCVQGFHEESFNRLST